MYRKFALWTMIFIVSLAIIIMFLPDWINPGPLSKGHEKIDDECFACHVILHGPASELCMVCHKPEEIGSNKSGNARFHQQLTKQDCNACHSDHKGRAAAAASGGFNHELLKPETKANCIACHTAPKNTLHAKAETRCHQCHSLKKWKPATFDHTRLFRFDRHHPSDCVSCHMDQTYAKYTCYNCHEHSPAKVRREHLEEGIRDFDTCSTCHCSGDEDEAERIWTNLKRRDYHQRQYNRPSAPVNRYEPTNRNGYRHNDDDDDDDDHH